ncbi:MULTISPECIES: chemotaxis protein CheW [unclassified Sporolactobacillus]|uniref:chemotaxis protein CheW n=1 Tax=unclassified Sporolactobacillus TaxID=2628533 RepID=UPI002367EDDE|nr:chemotaxis protein CheW [Sporolactobacillus sp. CQH2019]MDD9147043.1 chemotaxis protein CheW [Sporolactobacillus sp. CQH2019]
MEGESFKVILFKLNGETYGVPIDQVLSIERVQPVTRVPNAAEYVLGVMNLRGLIVPVIDVRRRFHMNRSELTAESRVVIADVGEIQVGLLVDSAKEVMNIKKDSIEKTPDIVGGPEAEYINGVARITNDDLLILLNLDRVLSDEEIGEIKQIEV